MRILIWFGIVVVFFLGLGTHGIREEFFDIILDCLAKALIVFHSFHYHFNFGDTPPMFSGIR